MNLTEEQAEVVSQVSKHDGIFAVNAVAGSGKTFTAKNVASIIAPKHGFYTAFNKGIVNDSAKKMKGIIECRTIHSLAFQSTRKFRYDKPIMPFTYRDIKENVGYPVKKDVIKVIDNFFLSDSLDIVSWAADDAEFDETPDLVEKYVNLMMDGRICPTFNFLLKLMHLMMDSGELYISKDLLILDECQDTTAVTLEIIKLIDCPKKVLLGDMFQNIYSFMHTVNAFQLMYRDITEFLSLTKSFRCTPDVASEVETFGRNYLSPSFKYSGTEGQPEPTTKAYLSRSNMALLKAMYDILQSGQSFKTIRPINEIFALPMSLITAAEGGVVTNYEYKWLNDEYHRFQKSKKEYDGFFDYLKKVVKDDTITYAIKVIGDLALKNVTINQLYKAVVNRPRNNTTVLSTVHTMKGLEADEVILSDDLNMHLQKIHKKMEANEDTALARSRLDNFDLEELNIYYVAMTRARSILHNSQPER